nr:uncharacterized protein LOC110568825 isoform X3 [Aotus nancymaae]
MRAPEEGFNHFKYTQASPNNVDTYEKFVLSDFIFVRTPWSVLIKPRWCSPLHTYFRTARQGCTSTKKLSKSVCAELWRHQRAREHTPDQLPCEVPEAARRFDFLGAAQESCQLSVVH